MRRINFSRFQAILAIVVLSSFLTGCATSANSRYFGKTQLPKDNVLRYISGAEPASLDPQISSGQPEARIYMAIFEGLVETDPKTLQAIPAIAKSWDISPKVDEFVFHLRDNAKWSDGTPIRAQDFVYSFRRGFAPDTLSPTSSLGYFIKYAEAYNSNQVFVKKNGAFLTAKDVSGSTDEQKNAAPDESKVANDAKNPDVKTADANSADSKSVSEPKNPAPFTTAAETDFHKLLKSPDRLVLDGDEKTRAKQIAADPKLKAATDGAEFVPVKAEDVGIEAVDDYTVRIVMRQSAPFFLGLLAHQFFRLVPQKVIEQWGKNWARPEHIITCGPFKLKKVSPYDAYITERDPNYWDAANVHLDGIEFYPIEEQATQMNLYKAGEVDAFLNHAVPASWIDEIRQYKAEYLDYPENSTAYYSMNVTKPPFNDPKVRQAFALSIDRAALAKYRKVQQPLYFQTPSGIFPDYDRAMEKVGEEIRQEKKLSPEEWEKIKKKLDPERARKLLGEAGFPVQQSGNSFSCPTFPTDKVSVTYNTTESNRQVAEFVQAQWKQNLGITIPLKNMEFKTFLPFRKALQYDGFAQSLWSGDYMDPFTFLGLHYGKDNDGGAGFNDPKYDKMLDDANSELDTQKRYEKLARAEYYLLDQLPSVPLSINATSWMKKPYVKGMYPNPNTLFAWKFVYIERDPNKWDTDGSKLMSETDPQVEKQLEELNATQTRKAE